MKSYFKLIKYFSSIFNFTFLILHHSLYLFYSLIHYLLSFLKYILTISPIFLLSAMHKSSFVRDEIIAKALDRFE